ncbi:MAG: hypothetical protein Q4C47_03185 [Planctomycetia bacterium]|nr:hypothetical protein [Planctomycetia bacterium]
MKRRDFLETLGLATMVSPIPVPPGMTGIAGTTSTATAQENDSAPEPVVIGTRLECFVDSFLIGALDGVTQKLHEPRDEGPVLFFDRPWEGPFSGYVTVFHDGIRYRMYYRGGPTPGNGDNSDEQTCYAESEDGKIWTKPDLGLYEWGGTRGNNILLDGEADLSHNFAPFHDTNPDVPSEERYKALCGNEKVGLIAFVSADGIHWRKLREEPVAKHRNYACDSQNVAFWSESGGKYLCYLRVWDSYWSGFRSVARIESPDFRTWTPDGGLFMTYGDSEREHIYTNQTTPYYRAPHICLATAARFVPDKRAISAEDAQKCQVSDEYDHDCSDAVLMSTRGGNVYDRTFMEGLIRPGTDPGDWVSRTNYPARGVVPTGMSEMSMYAQKYYAQPRARLHRYSLRVDGFASIHAPYSGGTFRTKPLVFTGENLYINAGTSAPGTIRVEIQTVSGESIPGYTWDQSPVLTGNWIEKKVVWADDRNVAELAGTPVVLRFFMKDADLYSLRFL